MNHTIVHLMRRSIKCLKAQQVLCENGVKGQGYVTDTGPENRQKVTCEDCKRLMQMFTTPPFHGIKDGKPFTYHLDGR